MSRQSLWETVTRQSLVTREMAIFASNDPLVSWGVSLPGCGAYEARPTPRQLGKVRWANY